MDAPRPAPKRKTRQIIGRKITLKVGEPYMATIILDRYLERPWVVEIHGGLNMSEYGPLNFNLAWELSFATQAEGFKWAEQFMSTGRLATFTGGASYRIWE